ncbi:hypothetical protein HDU67_001157 [Dinochytrium kinnereticum]|nr:hypothetical protein HDU67_001157 [Dinochytrium kinnereticum]
MPVMMHRLQHLRTITGFGCRRHLIVRQVRLGSSKRSLPESESTVIYRGPIAGGVKVLKRVSVVSLAMTYSVTPLFAFASSQSSVAAISVMAVELGQKDPWGVIDHSFVRSNAYAGFPASTALLTSSLSTALVQWCCKPYIVAISKPIAEAESNTSPSPDQKDAPLTLETLNFFGFPRRSTVYPGDLQKSSNRLFSTWMTADRQRFFYVHPELSEGFDPEMEALMQRIDGAANGKTGATPTPNAMDREKFDHLRGRSLTRQSCVLPALWACCQSRTNHHPPRMPPVTIKRAKIDAWSLFLVCVLAYFTERLEPSCLEPSCSSQLVFLWRFTRNMLAIWALFALYHAATVAGQVTTPCSMIQQVNRYRRSIGATPLVLDRRLVAAAQYHAEDQAAKVFMAHDSSNGQFWGERLAEYYPNWNFLSENVAMRSDNETEIMGVWIRSPYHEANLRDSRARFFGSGYKNGHWTQDFANAMDIDVPFPVDCTRESGFEWPQPATATPHSSRNFVGTIVTPDRLCLDASNGRGGVLLANTCVTGSSTQSWTLKKYGSGFYAQQTGTNLCVDVFNRSRANGTVLGIWDCRVGSTNQVFVMNLQNAWIASHSGLCAELANAAIIHPTRTPVTQWACNGGSNQRFIPTAPVAGTTQRYGFVGTVRSSVGLCLDSARGVGFSLQANTCVSGRASQSWTLVQNGNAFMLQNTGSNRCADLSAWNMNNGATIGVIID